MSVADRADLPLFHAPDGTAHVDRRGLSADTPRSWRRAHDPAVVRRRAGIRTAAIGGGALVLSLLGGAAGLAVTSAVWGPVGDGANLVGGAGLGFLVVSWIVLAALLLHRPVAEPPDVVRVPDDVLAAAPAGADSARLWSWSVASAAEAALRPHLHHRLQVERPGQEGEARAAREEYRRAYRDHVAACGEMGSTPREPVVPLDTRI
ncbi:hypothetical protein BFL35_05705 [Clavibacter michiganensis]|nr:hypothetical protein BFL35_05705 [Clavibacter michiganensis]